MVGLADMPLLRPTTLKAMASAMTDNPLVAPVYRGRRGHPVGFGAQFFSSLCRLQGDSGARSILQRYKQLLYLLPVDDVGVLLDVDVPADLERLHQLPDHPPAGVR